MKLIVVLLCTGISLGQGIPFLSNGMVHARSGVTPVLLHSASHACTTSVTTCSVTITSSTSGSLLVATASVRNDVTQTLTSFTDSGSQTWSFAKNTGNIATHAIMAIGYICNTSSGITTVTWTTPTAGDGVIGVEEWSGIATSSCLDIAATQDTTALAQTWTSANTSNTTNASDLLIGIVFNNISQSITQTGSGGWTTDVNVGSSFSGFSMAMAYRIVTSTGNYTNSGSASSVGTSNYPGSAAFKTQ